jgi:hypothetical protein
VTSYRGGAGELETTMDYTASGYTTTGTQTTRFECDGGFYLLSSDATYVTDGRTTRVKVTYDDPVESFPAELAKGTSWTAQYDYSAESTTDGETYRYSGSYSFKNSVTAEETVDSVVGERPALKLKQEYRQDETTSTSTAWIVETVGTVEGDSYELVEFEP